MPVKITGIGSFFFIIPPKELNNLTWLMSNQSSPIVSVKGSVVAELNAFRASESCNRQEAQAAQAKAEEKVLVFANSVKSKTR